MIARVRAGVKKRYHLLETGLNTPFSLVRLVVQTRETSGPFGGATIGSYGRTTQNGMSLNTSCHA